MATKQQSVDAELSAENFYRTNDMALATWLKLSGHAPQDVKWVQSTCYWFFDKSDLLLGAVDAFLDGTARVEPREYNRVFALTKREFYDSDPSPDPRRRRQGN